MTLQHKIEKFKVGEIQPFPHGYTQDICKIADKINEIIDSLTPPTEKLNYVDSRTPEERERDEKMKTTIMTPTTVFPQDFDWGIMYNLDGVVVKNGLVSPSPEEGWKEKLKKSDVRVRSPFFGTHDEITIDGINLFDFIESLLADERRKWENKK